MATDNFIEFLFILISMQEYNVIYGNYMYDINYKDGSKKYRKMNIY